jgi:hypothetical protein
VRQQFLCTATTNFPAADSVEKFRLVENQLKRVGTDPTFSRRIFSLTNHIAEIWFSLDTFSCFVM